MDFEEIKRVPLGDVATAIVKEGGAVTGGLLVAGFAGRQAENMLMGATPVTPTSTFGDKVKAAGANLVPKVVGWYLLRGRTGAAEDARKGFVTSAAFDLLMRLTHSGVNPATATVMGYQILGAGNVDVQKLLQENNVLKVELNKAVKQLAVSGIRVQEVPAPSPPPYPLTTTAPARHEEFGFMEGPKVRARQRDFGFAGESVMSTDRVAKMFGML